MANASISQIKVGNITYDICDAKALPSNADTDYALAIKNQNNSKNILTVDWDGDVVCNSATITDPYNTSSTLQLGNPTYDDHMESKTVADSTNTTLGSLTVPAGIWLAVVKVHFHGTSSTGRRSYTFTSDSSSTCSSTVGNYATTIPPASGYYTDSWLPAMIVHSSSETFYIRVYQNSGSSMDVGYRVRLIRLQ